MYVPNNMVLTLVGDIDPGIALAEIKKYFLPYPRRSFQERPLISEKPQPAARRFDVEEDLDMAYFAMGYKSVDIFNADMAALDVLASILGQGSSSRFNTILYRKKNLVYSIGAWNYTPKDPGLFIISGVAEPDKMEAGISAVSEEIKKIKNGSISKDELERVKAMVITDHIYSIETLSGQAGDIASSQITTGDYDFSARYIEMINDITVDDVRRVAQEYLVDTSLSVVTLSSLKRSSPDVKPVNGLAKDIKRSTLSNGINYLILEDHRVPTVSLIACSLGGLRVEPEERAGISNLTALMLLKGTRNRSENDISSFTEGMGASLSYFSGNNTLGIRLTLLSKDAAEGIKLLKEILLEPSFPEDILAREKNTIMAIISATDDNIFESGMELFKRTLYKKHPYRFRSIGTAESVSALKREDLEEFHKKYFVSKNMAIGVFGDIEQAEAEEMIAGAFSDMPANDAPRFARIAEADTEKVLTAAKKLKKEQSLLLMGFKGTTVKSKDRYTLQLITTVLSGVSGRLATRLRERLGISYSVGAFSVPAIDPGYVALYVSTTNENIELAKREFSDQIKILNKKGLTPVEIESAKKELIGNHRAALQTNSAMAHQSTLDDLYGLGYDNYKRYDSIIDSITNDDIIAASKEYLRPSSHILVVIEGEES
jgi:zinc protease